MHSEAVEQALAGGARIESIDFSTPVVFESWIDPTLTLEEVSARVAKYYFLEEFDVFRFLTPQDVLIRNYYVGSVHPCLQVAAPPTVALPDVWYNPTSGVLSTRSLSSPREYILVSGELRRLLPRYVVSPSGILVGVIEKDISQEDYTLAEEKKILSTLIENRLRAK